MTRSERRLLVDTSILGIALTLLVTFLDYAGLLAAPERYFYDFRARRCQRYSTRPTTQIVHIDIDDKSLSELGHWPWPRSRLAEIVDEIRIAGAKTMVLDVILSEPDPYEIAEADIAATIRATSRPATRATTKVAATKPSTLPADDRMIVPISAVDNDKALGRAIGRFGRAIVPLSLNINAPPNKDPIYLAMIDEMAINPKLSKEELLVKLIERNFRKEKAADVVEKNYVFARDEGMFQRISLESGDAIPSEEWLRGKIFPTLSRLIGNSVELHVMREQLTRFAKVQTLRRFAVKIPPNYPKLIDTREEYATLRVLGENGWATGYFDFVRPSDGTVRFIPLLANHHGYAYPQLGLALACAVLEVQPRDLIVTKDSITIPCKGKPIVIPVHTQETYRGSYDMFIDIPWFGPPVDSGWQRMYDWPDHKETKQHVPIHLIYEACETRHKIIKNNKQADVALEQCLTLKDDQGATLLNNAELEAQAAKVALMDPAEAESRLSVMAKVVQKVDDIFPGLEEVDETGLDIYTQERIHAYKVLKLLLEENVGHINNLKTRRAEIREALNGKAAIIGWIAVGSIADVIPTSLHSQCPGVVAHGVIFNAIMTRDFWRRPAAWVTLLITALMGLLVTAIVAMLPPWRALAATVAVGAGYFLFNGYYVFDKHNLIVGLAGPLTAALLVWAGGTLARFILEAGLRAQVTRSFSMRVDPQLVSYVLEHDPRVHGQVKELSVVFTDLAGFTSLSEQLKEETVPLLNEYMGLMVPVIRRHKGYLNKFLGDGIMYFFGAPYDNPNHAFDAVASVLEMQEVMIEFNKSLTQRNLPNMAVRAGISAGNMVVGDAGAEDTHDYTVLGDAVNLGARLEPANKVFGTQILINARARELVGERILFRPIGNIQVMGKKEGVMTFEPLALAEKATDQQKKLAELTGEVVNSFMSARFEACLAAVGKLEAAFGASKLTALYRRLSEQYLKDGAPAGFDGQIVLSEK